ncbi:hypothetical protein HJD18_16700 [Thermoleophilia bacterium SCSIO 60948]|nr:hypothetical protein HJD18_16700 [Thermoleophilia bacterium SCSIO 60948]
MDGLEAALARIAEGYRSHAPVLRAVREAAAYDDALRAEWRRLIGRFVVATPGPARTSYAGPDARPAGGRARLDDRAHASRAGGDRRRRSAQVSAALARIRWAALAGRDSG